MKDTRLARAAQPAVESLEARQLLSGTPSLTIQGPATVNEGSPYVLNLSASAGANLTSWSIDWGDGTTSALPGSATTTAHVYSDGPHDYTISATGANADGTFKAVNGAGGGSVNDGSLDVSFGTGGKVVGGNGFAQAVLALPDGHVLVGGATSAGDFLLTRYNADGSLDATFGNGGSVTTDMGASDQVNALTLETVNVPDPLNPGQFIPQTRIVAVGQSFIGFNQNDRFAVARYNLDGSLDTTFGAAGTGKVLTQLFAFNTDDQARSVAINPVNGDIVVGGTLVLHTGNGDYDSFALAAYKPDGTLDTAFGPTGSGVTPADSNSLFNNFQSLNQITVLPDGKILAAGQAALPVFSAVLVRFNANGTLDTTFGNGGMVSAGPGTGLALSVRPDGSVLMGGYNGAGSGINVERFTSAYALDTTYGVNGVASTVVPDNGLEGFGGFAVQSDGSAVFAAPVYNGGNQDVALFRLTPNGTPDTSFGVNGQVTTDFGSADWVAGITLDAAGRILAAGHTFDPNTFVTQVALARYGGAPAPLSVHVDNVPPSVSLVAPTGAVEGSAVTFNATVTDPGTLDNVTESWTVTLGGNTIASGTGAAVNFTPADNGSYLVSMTVTDKDGAATTATTTVAVANVAPTVTVTAPATGPEGSPVSFSATAADASSVDVAAGLSLAWTVTSNGNVVAQGTGAAGQFTPADNGAYVVTFTATDKDGGVSTPASATVNITNVAPTLTVTGDTSGVRGQARHLTLTTTDPSAADLAAGFNYTINWGDGTTQTVHGGASLTVGHAYALDGSYNVTVTATDKDGGASNAVSRNMQILPWQLQGTKLAIGGLTADDFIIITEDGPNGAKVVKVRDDLLLTAGFSDAQVSEIDLYQVDDDGIVVAHSVTDPVYLVDANGNVIETIYGGK